MCHNLGINMNLQNTITHKISAQIDKRVKIYDPRKSLHQKGHNNEKENPKVNYDDMVIGYFLE